MFVNLTEGIRRRLLMELRQFWSYNSKYRESLVPNIQGKYSFKERPQQAIILKNASATPMQLAADNFQGTVVSYCHLTKVFEQPGLAIEWVREDGRAIRANNGMFPSPAGVYYIEIKKEDASFRGVVGEHYVFYVDPLLEVRDESPVPIGPRLYEVSAGSFHTGSLRVFEMPGSLPMYDGINYVSDPATGQITLAKPVGPGNYLSVDYRYAAASTGPFLVGSNQSNNSAIPGVVLAFGRSIQEDDIMAVVVTEMREDAALEYGGRWEMSLDMDIMARDVHSQAEITDRTVMYLHGILRNNLSSEGIEITTVSMGGEAEEIYDETGDDYFYTASISVSLLTDWAIHVPMGASLSRVAMTTVDNAQALAGLSDEDLADSGSPTNLRLAQDLGLVSLSDPWFRDRTRNYDMIR